MQNIVIGVLALAVIVGGAYLFLQTPAEEMPPEENGEGGEVAENGSPEQPDMGERTAVATGSYTADASTSIVRWAGGKPLVPGYTHRGTISLSDGSITVTENGGTGAFTLDMSSIAVTSVGGGKEGSESGLERHLKDGDFFDVTAFPTATVTITDVTPVAGAEHQYTIDGELTMKDVSEDITFPAIIYADADGHLRAEAQFAIDRTRWGITFASGSLFDNLAENAIADEISLELALVATPAQ